MLRDDGSIRSGNIPIWANRHQIRDWGVYRGVVRDVIYTDDDANDSGQKTANEVVYTVMVIGGDRDGQTFQNCRLMKTLGGFANYEEVILKKVEGFSQLDPANPLSIVDPSLSTIAKYNGDVVYIQFVNGDPHLPLIIGLGYHQAAKVEATSDDGQRYLRKFNGISTEITKDGEFTWSKDNGAEVAAAPNLENLKYPLINQFAPLPGQTEAVKFTLDNKYSFALDFKTGLNVTIDGLTDEFSFTTAAGADYTISGLSDSHALTTLVGTGLKIDGITDSLELSTAAGASIKVSGIDDSFELSTTAGNKLSASLAGGISMEDVLGDALTLNKGTVTLENVVGAQLELGPTGFIKFGNAEVDVLKDVLQALIMSMSTAVYSGFGAPGSNVADLVQLLAKITLVTGG